MKKASTYVPPSSEEECSSSSDEEIARIEGPKREDVVLSIESGGRYMTAGVKIGNDEDEDDNMNLLQLTDGNIDEGYRAQHNASKKHSKKSKKKNSKKSKKKRKKGDRSSSSSSSDEEIAVPVKKKKKTKAPKQEATPKVPILTRIRSNPHNPLLPVLLCSTSTSSERSLTILESALGDDRIGNGSGSVLLSTAVWEMKGGWSWEGGEEFWDIVRGKITPATNNNNVGLPPNILAAPNPPGIGRGRGVSNAPAWLTKTANLPPAPTNSPQQSENDTLLLLNHHLLSTLLRSKTYR